MTDIEFLELWHDRFYSPILIDPEQWEETTRKFDPKLNFIVVQELKQDGYRITGYHVAISQDYYTTKVFQRLYFTAKLTGMRFEYKKHS